MPQLTENALDTIGLCIGYCEDIYCDHEYQYLPVVFLTKDTEFIKHCFTTPNQIQEFKECVDDTAYAKCISVHYIDADHNIKEYYRSYMIGKDCSDSGTQNEQFL